MRTHILRTTHRPISDDVARRRGRVAPRPPPGASLGVQGPCARRANPECGVPHLRVLMGRFPNDLPLVLAAYNAGDLAVIAYGGVPPYPQTRRYVVRVLRR